MFRRKIEWIGIRPGLSLLAVLISLSQPMPVQARICIPARVTDVIVWWSDRQGLPVHESGTELFAALRRLHGPTFWRRTADYGYFDIPKNYTVDARFWLLPSRNLVWFASHPARPGLVYVFWFLNVPPFALPDGSHYGLHGCRAFTISAAAAEQIYQTVRQGTQQWQKGERGAQ